MAIEKNQNLVSHFGPDAEYLFYIKLIATYALTFFGHIISVLASMSWTTVWVTNHKNEKTIL